MTQRGCNQQSPEYGKLYSTDALVSSINKRPGKNKKREAELLDITGDLRDVN